MPNLTSEHIENLNALKKYFKKRPSRLRMSNWLITTNEKVLKHNNINLSKAKGRNYFNFSSSHFEGDLTVQVVPECGTTCCIGGAAYLLKHTIEEYNKLFDKHSEPADILIPEARNILGLGNNNAFYLSSWPSELQTRYANSKNATQRVKIVCGVIDLLIKNDGFLYPRSLST